MSYTTIADLRKRLSESKLIQLTDYQNAGIVDTAIVAAALDASAAMIDSYAAGRYALPLLLSGQVKDLETTIAIYKLHEGRQLDPEQVRRAYEDAIAFLKDVSKGNASLDQSAKLQTSALDVKRKDHTTSPDAFDNLRLADFIG